MCLSLYLSRSVSTSASSHLFLSLSIHLSYLSICLHERKQLRETNRSKTKQFCATSSKNKRPQLQNEEMLRDFLKFSKLATAKTKQVCDDFVPISFVIFLPRLSKVLHLPRKNAARSYEVLRLSRKIILANLTI